jgi:hypothetical protein
MMRDTLPEKSLGEAHRRLIHFIHTQIDQQRRPPVS